MGKGMGKGGCAGCATGCFYFILTALQVICGFCILLIILLKLQDYNVEVDVDTDVAVDQDGIGGLDAPSANVTVECLLEPTDDQDNLCRFTLVTLGFTFVASIALSLVQCCTCNLCGCGDILEAAFSVCAAIWWGSTAFALTESVKEFTNRSDIRYWKGIREVENYQDAVVAFAWLETILFAATAAVSFMRILCGVCDKVSSKK